MRQRYDKTKLFYTTLIIAFGVLFLSDFARMPEGWSIGAQLEKAVPQGDPTVAVYVEGQTPGARAASGSGVILDVEEDVLWVVTAGHVLERAGAESPVMVEFREGSTTECLRYENASDADLAFLCIFKKDLPEGFQERTAAGTDKERYDALASGDIVQATGYRDGKLITFSGVLSEPWIYVEDFEQYMMVAVCGMDYGMSGGGLYDEEGHLIGIACGGNEQGELAAVPLHVVWARFADLRR